MKKLNQGFVPILILILIVLAVVGYFGYKNFLPKIQSLVLSPSPTPLVSPKPTAEAADPTANWKIYTNTKYGFTVKYPNDFKIDEFDYDSDGVFVTLYKGEKVSSGPIDPYSKAISITFSFRTSLSDPNDACFEYGGIVGICASFTNSGTVFHKDTVMINNVTGVFVQSDDYNSKHYYLKNLEGSIKNLEGKSVVEVTLWNQSPAGSAGSVDDMKLLEQILSTFKFTN